jgi:uncharacterized protein (TIGR02217 family)
MSAFHETRLPARLAFGCTGGVERRSSPWSQGRRRYLIATAARPLDDAAELVAFFEARKGRLHGFRFRDPTDFKSCVPSAQPAATDQAIGTGDGVRKAFPLAKTYGSGVDTVSRPIAKPVAGTVKVAVAGVALAPAVFTVDTVTGIVTLTTAPALGAAITAGFEFDTPVRFDIDRLDVQMEGFTAARVTACPLVEVRV